MYSFLLARKGEFPTCLPPEEREAERTYSRPLLLVFFNFYIRPYPDKFPFGCLCNPNFISIRLEFHCSVIRNSSACADLFYTLLIINRIQKSFFTFPERLLIVRFFLSFLLLKR